MGTALLKESVYAPLAINRNQLWLLRGFPAFALIALCIDSQFFAQHYFNGRQIANLITVCYFIMLFRSSGIALRRLMVVMVPLSYIGEVIFCKGFGMYEYRTGAIPLYVPVGHAVIYATGVILAHTPFALSRDGFFRKFFTPLFIALFLFVTLFFKDIFSAVCGILFFLLMYRKRWQNLYYFIALCVIFIEVTGTQLGCWAYMPVAFELHTTNPPLAAVFFYAGGDVLLIKIIGSWERKKLKNLTIK
jgi:hypothetical protein